MAEKITIKIHPSGVASESLTVEDAMHQVLDFISLLQEADGADGGNRIVWRLESASTNSPLEIVAIATSVDPVLSVDFHAIRAKERIHSAFEVLSHNGPMPDWMIGRPASLAGKFFHRNMNGIGRTDITFNEAKAPIIIVHGVAKVAALSIEQSRISEELQKRDLTRSEFGTVEGEIVSTITHNGRPAFVIKERLSEEKVSCILSNDLAKEIGPNHSWDETWRQVRILVTGELHYDSNGSLKKIDAYSIEPVRVAEVALKDLQSIDFLGGKSPNAALKEVWSDG